MSRRFLSLFFVLIAGTAVPAAALAQGQGLPPEDPRNRPQEPPRVNNRVHVKIEQHVDEPNILQHKRLYPPLRFEENGNLVVIDAETWYAMPQRDPEVPLNLSLGVRVTFLTFGIGAGSGGFPLGIPSKGIIGDPPPPTGTPEEGDPPPPGTKPSQKATVFGSDSGGGTDSAPFVGPELLYPLLQDASQWTPTRWLPEGSSVEIYGRAQMGSLQFDTTSTSATLYGLGLRLNLPFYRTESFHADATISAGPAYLQTKLGNATVLDAAAGARAVQSLSAGMNLYAEVQIDALSASGDSTIGPSFSLGLDLSW